MKKKTGGRKLEPGKLKEKCRGDGRERNGEKEKEGDDDEEEVKE